MRPYGADNWSNTPLGTQLSSEYKFAKLFPICQKMAFFSLSMMAETGIIFGIVFAFFGLIAISTFLIAKRLSPKKSRKNIISDEFPRIEEVTISSETVRGLRFPERQREKKKPEILQTKTIFRMYR